MLSFEECCSMCGLSEKLVAAIAEHEEIPEMVALELGACLLERPDGALRVLRFIEDDIAAARRRHDARHEKELIEVLREFRDDHAGEIPPPG